jgi:hypothetical protein
MKKVKSVDYHARRARVQEEKALCLAVDHLCRAADKLAKAGNFKQSDALLDKSRELDLMLDNLRFSHALEKRGFVNYYPVSKNNVKSVNKPVKDYFPF